MTKAKIAVTVPRALLQKARRAVREGRADSVSAYVTAALEEKTKLDDLAALLALAPGKPIMIAETASVESPGSKPDWIHQALTIDLPQSFPNVKALVWFNWRIFENNTWRDWPIESSAATESAFQTAIGSPYYLAGGSFGSLPTGTKILPP